MASYINSTHSFKWVKSQNFQNVNANTDTVCVFDSLTDNQLLAFFDDDVNGKCYRLTTNDTVTIQRDGYYTVVLNVNMGTNAPNTYAIAQIGIEPYTVAMAPPVCSEAQDFVAFNNGFVPFNISLSPTAIVRLRRGQQLKCHILTNNACIIYPSSNMAFSLLNIGL